MTKGMKIAVAVLAVLLVAVVGFYVYDITVNGTPYGENLVKVAVVCVSLIASIGKIVTRTSAKRRPLAFYEKSYAKEIGNAFSRDEKSRKKLLEAIRFFNEDKFEKAISLLNSLKKQRPAKNDLAVVCLFSALCYESWGLADSAIEEYRQLISNDDKNSRAYSNLGILYQNKGDLDSAFDCFCSAVEIDQNNHVAINNLAQFYFKVGEYRAAIYYSQKALELVPNFRQSATLLAIIFGAAGYEQQYDYYKNLAVSNGANAESIERLAFEMEIDLDSEEESLETAEEQN